MNFHLFFVVVESNEHFIDALDKNDQNKIIHWIYRVILIIGILHVRCVQSWQMDKLMCVPGPVVRQTTRPVRSGYMTFTWTIPCVQPSGTFSFGQGNLPSIGRMEGHNSVHLPTLAVWCTPTFSHQYKFTLCSFVECWFRSRTFQNRMK